MVRLREIVDERYRNPKAFIIYLPDLPRFLVLFLIYVKSWLRTGYFIMRVTDGFDPSTTILVCIIGCTKNICSN